MSKPNNYYDRPLDTIVKEWTAFKSFDDLMKSVRDNGYVPTIRDEQPYGWQYRDWDNHPFRWDKERLRDAVREAGGKVYPELDRPWDEELNAYNNVSYTFRWSDLKMKDLHKEIKKRKTELKRACRGGQGLQFFPAEVQILACDARGDRLDNVGKFYDPLFTGGMPTKQLLREHIEDYKEDTHFLYLCSQLYWIDPADPMEYRYENAEPSGDYWGLHIHVRS